MAEPQVLERGEWDLVTPEIAGWHYLSFQVVRFADGQVLSLPADGNERALVNLSGDFEVTAGSKWFEFGGRDDVFAGLGHCLYLPRDTAAEVRGGAGAELAITSAPATMQLEPVLVTPGDASPVARGAGTASRQVSATIPSEFPADRLHIVEVWTPGGNWSSYPPHKHEREADDETELEETYHYRLRDPERGWALQRVYSPERGFEFDQPVHDGDICLIPWGYHTTVAAHDQDLYYLNALAGPAPQRSLQAAEDPALAPSRLKWDEMTVDERVPLVPQHRGA
jgi:5-deoxy-glucuronate isomerase